MTTGLTTEQLQQRLTEEIKGLVGRTKTADGIARKLRKLGIRGHQIFDDCPLRNYLQKQFTEKGYLVTGQTIEVTMTAIQVGREHWDDDVETAEVEAPQVLQAFVAAHDDDKYPFLLTKTA